MPNEELIAIALASTLSIFALIALYRWPYRHYRVDRFRDEMFDARAHLFHLAAAGTLRFDDKAYGILRSILNGFIRFGGTLDMSSAFAIAYTDPQGNRESNARRFALEWRSALAELDDATRTEVLRIEKRMHRAVLVHLMLSSPPLFLLALPVLALAMAPVVTVRLSSWLWRRAAPLLVRVDSEALKVGSEQLGNPQAA